MVYVNESFSSFYGILYIVELVLKMLFSGIFFENNEWNTYHQNFKHSENQRKQT